MNAAHNIAVAAVLSRTQIRHVPCGYPSHIRIEDTLVQKTADVLGRVVVRDDGRRGTSSCSSPLTVTDKC